MAKLPTRLSMVQWSSRSLARDRLSPEDFIEPCQPVLSGVVPVGPDWVHELKHDGGDLARKDGDRVRLWSRNGRNWTGDFPGIVAALTALPSFTGSGWPTSTTALSCIRPIGCWRRSIRTKWSNAEPLDAPVMALQALVWSHLEALLAPDVSGPWQG